MPRTHWLSLGSHLFLLSAIGPGLCKRHGSSSKLRLPYQVMTSRESRSNQLDWQLKALMLELEKEYFSICIMGRKMVYRARQTCQASRKLLYKFYVLLLWKKIMGGNLLQCQCQFPAKPSSRCCCKHISPYTVQDKLTSVPTLLLIHPVDCCSLQ